MQFIVDKMHCHGKFFQIELAGIMYISQFPVRRKSSKSASEALLVIASTSNSTYQTRASTVGDKPDCKKMARAVSPDMNPVFALSYSRNTES